MNNGPVELYKHVNSVNKVRRQTKIKVYLCYVYSKGQCAFSSEYQYLKKNKKNNGLLVTIYVAKEITPCIQNNKDGISFTIFFFLINRIHQYINYKILIKDIFF